MRISSFFLLFLMFHPIYANVIGSDAQNFNPAPDGLDYVTVFSSETLEPGILNIGMFLNYAENTFPTFSGQGNAPTQSLLDKNDSLTSGDLNFAFGILPNWHVGVSLPYVLNQTIDDDQNIGKFNNQGFTETRFSSKYRLTKREPWGYAVVASLNLNRIKNNPYVGESPSPTYNLEFVIDRRFGLWSWALNVGHRWRNPGTPITNTGIEPFPNQWVASSAFSRLLTNIDTKLILEIYGSYPAIDVQNASDRQNSSLEALAGIKYDYNENLALHFGSGTELSHGTSTPDWRAYAGLNWVMGPVYIKSKAFTETQTKKGSLLTSTGLNFASNSAELTSTSKILMQEIVNRLKLERNNIRYITVLGHTDSVGPAKYNQKLSERRASTVKKILIKDIPLPADTVFSRGYGEDRPLTDNGNYQGRRRNRRVELDIEKR